MLKFCLPRRAAPAVFFLACMGCVWAQPDAFVKTEAMVPMRDGVRLHTNIFTPRRQSEPLPILFTRTPYGAVGDPAVLWSSPNVQALAPDGYIFVYQDIRGRFASEGRFVMQRPPAAPGGIDEGTDAYDTIDWLLKNVPRNNGKPELSIPVPLYHCNEYACRISGHWQLVSPSRTCHDTHALQMAQTGFACHGAFRT